MSTRTSKNRSSAQGSDPEIEAIGKVLAALEPLSPDARDRVAKYVSAKLEMNAFAPRSATKADSKGSQGADEAYTTPAGGAHMASKVATWMKQNSISDDEVAEVFHVADDEVSVLANEMPGRTDKERAMNTYLVAGVAEFIRSGAPSFTDKAARELCITMGCYDQTNHTKRIKGKELAGSKDKGWILTAPGLKKAASLIKEIGAPKA